MTTSEENEDLQRSINDMASNARYQLITSQRQLDDLTCQKKSHRLILLLNSMALRYSRSPNLLPISAIHVAASTRR